jgi:hypothetical protein
LLSLIRLDILRRIHKPLGGDAGATASNQLELASSADAVLGSHPQRIVIETETKRPVFVCGM